MELTSATTVNKPPQEVYGFWHRLENLATFMAHLDDVRVTGPSSSHWAASAPFDTVVEWDAVTTGDVAAERIAWGSVEGADVDTSGEVLLRARAGRAGHRGARDAALRHARRCRWARRVAKYFGEDPSQALDDDLRRFKQVMETGEVVRSDGRPVGQAGTQGVPAAPGPAAERRGAAGVRGRKEVLA